MKFKPKSKLMNLMAMLGLNGVAWSLRRLHCPVDSRALVLDVGSGGNPYSRANVLLDAYEETFERYHSKLVKDRPLVYGQVENMPFKDKSFDFVIASHVLEHVSDPAKFLSELMRVAKAGYIETPDAFIEKLIPIRFHRLEVTESNDRLMIYKKSSWRPHADIVDLFEKKAKNRYFIKLMQKHPEPFYMRYYWSERIDYEIVNPDVKADWPHPPVKPEDYVGQKLSIRRCVTHFLRFCFSQNKRNSSLDLVPLLRCTSCHGAELSRHEDYLDCPKCGAKFPFRNGVPAMNEGHKGTI